MSKPGWQALSPSTGPVDTLPGREILTRLGAVRRRWWLLATLRVCLLAATLTSIWAATAAILGRATAGTAAAVGSQALLSLPALIGVALVGVALGAAHLLSRVPSLASLAAQADDTHRFQSRLSTAVEFAGKTGSSVVIAALMEDAITRSARVRANAIIPLVAPRWLIALPAALLLWTAAVLVPERLTATSPQVSGAGAEASRLDGETVKRVAELLAQDASASRSTYVQAVAEGFSQLGKKLASGQIDSAGAAETVSNLLNQLSQALERDVTGLAKALSEASPSAEERARTPEDAGAGAEPAVETLSFGLPGAAGAASGPSKDSGLDSLLQALESRAEATLLPTMPGQLDRQIIQDEYGGLQAPEIGGKSAAVAGPNAEGQGEPAGAAADSSDRAGDAAGAGDQPLTEGEVGALPPEEIAIEEVTLPWTENEDGRRVEIEVVPEPQQAVPVNLSDTAEFAFDRSAESAATREHVGGRYKEVVTRYFLPDPAATPPPVTE